MKKKFEPPIWLKSFLLIIGMICLITGFVLGYKTGQKLLYGWDKTGEQSTHKTKKEADNIENKILTYIPLSLLSE